MTRMEELLKETLAERALDIPEESTPPVSTTDGTRSTHHTRTVLISIAAAVLLVGGFATVRASLEQSSDGVVSPASETVPDIRGLVGKDVGDVLGLTPGPTDTDGCDAFAEYEDGRGFCYEGIVAGDEALVLLGRQISGHAPTEAGADYLAAAIELKAMRQGSIEYNAEREEALLAALAGEQPSVSTILECDNALRNVGEPDYGLPAEPNAETPVEQAERYVEGTRTRRDYPDVAVVLAEEHPTVHVIALMSGGKTVGILRYENDENLGWHLTNTEQCSPSR